MYAFALIMAIASGIILGWPSTNASVPTGAGWSRVTTLDGKHAKQIPNASTDPGTTGGTAQHHHAQANHNHTISHTHTSGNTGNSSESAQDTASGTPDSADVVHLHTTGTIAATGDSSSNESNNNTDDQNNDPARWDTIWIQSNGSPTIVPENAVVYFNNATLPNNWTQPANGKDKFLRGAAAAGDGGGTGGGASHTHSNTHTHTSAHTHPNGTTGNGPNLSNSNTSTNAIVAGDQHNHPYTVSSGNFGTSQDGSIATTGSATPEPPWIKLAVITPPAGGDAPRTGIIALWLGTIANIPGDWALCDGNGGRPNLCQGLFVKGCNLLTELLNTGGTATHSHTAGGTHTHTWTSTAHTHTVNTGAASTTTGATGTDQTRSAANHTHPTTSGAASAVTVGTADPSITDGGHEPEYVTAAYIQYTEPAAPAPIPDVTMAQYSQP